MIENFEDIDHSDLVHKFSRSNRFAVNRYSAKLLNCDSQGNRCCFSWRMLEGVNNSVAIQHSHIHAHKAMTRRAVDAVLELLNQSNYADDLRLNIDSPGQMKSAVELASRLIRKHSLGMIPKEHLVLVMAPELANAFGALESDSLFDIPLAIEKTVKLHDQRTEGGRISAKCILPANTAILLARSDDVIVPGKPHFNFMLAKCHHEMVVGKLGLPDGDGQKWAIVEDIRFEACNPTGAALITIS